MKPKYIIMCGTNKAATTSIFQYLSDHYDVCPSYIKQTNYFLDSSVQDRLNLKSIYNYSNDTISYSNFFKCNSSERYRLEASPDYMYFKSTVQKLKLFLDNNEGEIVIILRNPITRFISWFNFGKQQGFLDEETDFMSFYDQAKKYKGNTNLSLLAYKTGFYSKYLQEFFHCFDKEKLHIFFYEDLLNNPKNFMTNFSEKLKLDESFYENYDFKHLNKTIKVKYKSISWVYATIRTLYLKLFFKGSLGIKLGSFLKKTFSPIYQKINTEEIHKEKLDQNTINQLSIDFKTEKENLKKLLGINVIPW